MVFKNTFDFRNKKITILEKQSKNIFLIWGGGDEMRERKRIKHHLENQTS